LHLWIIASGNNTLRSEIIACRKLARQSLKSHPVAMIFNAFECKSKLMQKPAKLKDFFIVFALLE